MMPVMTRYGATDHLTAEVQRSRQAGMTTSELAAQRREAANKRRAARARLASDTWAADQKENPDRKRAV